VIVLRLEFQSVVQLLVDGDNKRHYPMFIWSKNNMDELCDYSKLQIWVDIYQLELQITNLSECAANC